MPGIERAARLRTLMVVAVLLAGPAAGAASADTDTPPVDPGRGAYVQYCASCHGINGRGDGPVAPALKHPPPDLTLITERNNGTFSDAIVAAFIDGRDPVVAHGPREMPIWGRKLGEKLGGGDVAEEMVRGQIAVLVDYLRSIQR